RALAQAVDSLLANEITPVLENFAFHERAVVRRQAALGLGRMACNGYDSVYELLEHWLAVEDANAGATVVLFWLTGGAYAEDERYESLKAIQSTFPLIFDRGVREAVRVFGTEYMTPRVAQLMQFSVL